MRLLNIVGKVIQMKFDSERKYYYILYETQKTVEYLNENSCLYGKLEINLFDNMNIINDIKLTNVYSCSISSSQQQQPVKIANNVVEIETDKPIPIPSPLSSPIHESSSSSTSIPPSPVIKTKETKWCELKGFKTTNNCEVYFMY